MTNHDSVYDSFFPLAYLNLFFCLTRIEKTDATYRLHPRYMFFPIVNLILLVGAVILYYFTYETYAVNESGVYYWSFRIFNLALPMRVFFIYAMRVVTHKEEAALYASIDDFDRQMVALGRGKDIAAANKRLARFNIAAIPISIVTYVLGEIYINAIADSGGEVAWFIIISRFVGSYLGILSKLQFCLWCTAITDRFAMVNDLMTKVQERFRLNNMFVVSVYKYEQCIEKYGDLHRHLTHLARRMNGVYQFDLLWHFAIMFVVIFTNAYYSTFMMLKRNDELKLPLLILNCLYICCEIVLNILSSTTLCGESYKALDIFNNLKVDPDDGSTQRLVISSIFEFKENRLEITACRFFSVNFSTLAVMTTIITNYVFILIQFEDSNVPGNGLFNDGNITTTLGTLIPYGIRND